MATYNTEWEQQLFAEMNRVRQNPKQYAQELKEVKTKYDGVFFEMPFTSQVIETEEGVAALNYAIRWLEKVDPRPAFRKISEGLSKSAVLLCNDNGSTGRTGNTLADGTSAQERWVRYGQWKGKIGENVCYALEDPRNVVQQWVIDDGQPNRPHLKSIMSTDFTCVGIAHGPHSAHQSICVVTFATAFIDGAPGKAPKVGTKGGGMTTRQSVARKTEESLIEGNPDDLVVEADVSDCLETRTMKLIARGKQLKLTRTVGTERKKKTKASSWQMPFMINPSTVVAKINAGKLVIRVPVPAETAAVGDRVVLGNYTLCGSGSAPKIDVDVKQSKGAITLSATPSKFDEDIRIVVEGDVVTFECAHKDVSVTSTGRNVLQTVDFAQPLRLPFVVDPSLVSVDDSSGLVVTVTKPGAGGGAEVQIPIQ